MNINDLSFDAGPSIYYKDDFRAVLEDHMSFLREHKSTSQLYVDANKAYKYEHDLFGFLANASVGAHLHWVIMRMNKMTSPMEFTLGTEVLLIPDVGLIDKIRQSHMSSRKLT